MTIDSTLSEIIVAVITGLLTAYATYRQARHDAEIKLLSMMDEGTAKARLEHYQTLWEKMKLLAEYPPAEHVPYNAVKKLNEEFRDWYFTEGGIYLTRRSKRRYLDAQKQLYETWSANLDKLDTHISPNEYAAAREKLSKLRDQLAQDLRSRLPPGAPAATPF